MLASQIGHSMFRILQYIKGIPNKGLLYLDCGYNCVAGFFDTDWEVVQLIRDPLLAIMSRNILLYLYQAQSQNTWLLFYLTCEHGWPLYILIEMGFLPMI